MRIQKNLSKFMTIIITSVIVFWMAIPADAMGKADEVDEKYQQAYNLILDKKWESASQLMDEIIRKYPKSAWVDDARFWKCYAMEKLEKSLENSFDCYKEFIRTYPGSKWIDDAKTNLIRLAQALRKAGKPEYEAIVRSMQQSEDEEIALEALYALKNRGDERSLSVIEELFDSNKNPKIRKKIVYVLGTFESTKAESKLIEIAKKDDEVDIRKEAIFWLGQTHPSERIIKLMKDLVYEDPDHEVRKKALFSLSQMDDERGLPLLIDIAKNHRDAAIRKEAIFWVGQDAESPKIIDMLKEFALTDPDPGVQKKAIFSLSQVPPEKGLPLLVNIAKKHKNSAMRKEAIFWLGQEAESQKIITALEEFAFNDPEPEVQKKAIFSLSQASAEKGLPALINVAKKHKDIAMREQAIFWLGQNAESQEIINTLRNFAFDDPDVGVQKKAVFALSQVSNAKGLPLLMNIARKHKSSEVREQAIFWLGQNASTKDIVEALEEFVLKDPDPDIQEKALFALSQVSDGKGIPALIKIAKDHPKTRIRKKAIFWLGQSEDERALKAIEEILYKK